MKCSKGLWVTQLLPRTFPKYSGERHAQSWARATLHSHNAPLLSRKFPQAFPQWQEGAEPVCLCPCTARALSLTVFHGQTQGGHVGGWCCGKVRKPWTATMEYCVNITYKIYKSIQMLLCRWNVFLISFERIVNELNAKNRAAQFWRRYYPTVWRATDLRLRVNNSFTVMPDSASLHYVSLVCALFECICMIPMRKPRAVRIFLCGSSVCPYKSHCGDSLRRRLVWGQGRSAGDYGTLPQCEVSHSDQGTSSE